ncbi:hypothetical protein M407DRAFT_142380 [Tulasnella calospora MUT 4182]|uniref:Phytocyanin domain-containing protein n=1 Tax=Tulasnella calospora MUT 4182 TaxID=1051891 RepID=A0A0C3Q7H6_9AGAM|nr:hypothetical protein M407DRAFT_142380 [Tulasnella calospora MUT 4182]
MHAKTLLAAFATIPLVHAAVWNVTVGQSGLTFSPNQVTAAVGDTIHFVINPGHSATQNTFATPCTAMSGGSDSGLVSAASTLDVMVSSTDPLWFHCAQVGHCPAGMVFAANAPSSGQTFAAYQAAAEGKAATGSTSSAAAAAASTTGSTSTGAYGNGAPALESKGWMVGVAAFIGAAAMI